MSDPQRKKAASTATKATTGPVGKTSTAAAAVPKPTETAKQAPSPAQVLATGPAAAEAKQPPPPAKATTSGSAVGDIKQPPPPAKPATSETAVMEAKQAAPEPPAKRRRSMAKVPVQPKSPGPVFFGQVSPKKTGQPMKEHLIVITIQDHCENLAVPGMRGPVSRITWHSEPATLQYDHGKRWSSFLQAEGISEDSLVEDYQLVTCTGPADAVPKYLKSLFTGDGMTGLLASLAVFENYLSHRLDPEVSANAAVVTMNTTVQVFNSSSYDLKEYFDETTLPKLTYKTEQHPLINKASATIMSVVLKVADETTAALDVMGKTYDFADRLKEVTGWGGAYIKNDKIVPKGSGGSYVMWTQDMQDADGIKAILSKLAGIPVAAKIQGEKHAWPEILAEFPDILLR